MWIVRFEMVSPVDHPEYYQDEDPVAGVQDVLPSDWKAVAVTHHQHPNAVQQFRGLKELARKGELVRNIKLRPVIDAVVLSNVPAEQFMLVQSDQQDPDHQSQQHGGQPPQDGEDHPPGQLPHPTRQ